MITNQEPCDCCRTIPCQRLANRKRKRSGFKVKSTDAMNRRARGAGFSRNG